MPADILHWIATVVRQRFQRWSYSFAMNRDRVYPNNALHPNAHRTILTYFLFKNYFNLYIYLYIFIKFLIFTQLYTILTPKTHQKSLKTRRNPPFFAFLRSE